MTSDPFDIPIEIKQAKRKKKSKYNNVAAWYEIGGKTIYLRSLFERDYARRLEASKQEGKIKEWEYEPHTFWFEGIRRGVCSYKPDFRITELDGSQSYVETKGYLDPKSKTKLKRMAKYFPEVKLILVRQTSRKRKLQ